MFDNIIENLGVIKPCQAFFILKNDLSIPKLIYLLRSAPCFECKKELETSVSTIKTNIEKICSVSFGKEGWSQASLPIRHGGLGLRSASDLSLPCFSSSSHACRGIVSCVLPFLTWDPPHGEIKDATHACSQHDYSLLNTKNLWVHCKLLAAQGSHTVAWFFPISNIGNLIYLHNF